MWQINKRFKDSTELSGNVTIFLNANKPLNPYDISYPITWSGFVNNQPIEIIQPSSSSSFMENYEFVNYPKGYYIYQNRIITLIDELLRKSLD
ncbi:hypothetical protein HX038_17635 [Myroides odoratimimus]|uniref:hypothetical protein n=1 Tax=Myroides odoratimimus TaxID=76832 RepID=UPI0025770BC2|nr:hypothetical protein [Myroides odoratimimus]MDM1412536.1 hypothetical protein [Myroides odoratimimus]MEC4007705.1 hypothetical protein [Myroides odoratimimus]